MVTQASQHERSSATALLVHYLGVAGVEWKNAEPGEIANFVDDIVDAAVAEVRDNLLSTLTEIRDDVFSKIGSAGVSPEEIADLAPAVCGQQGCEETAAYSYVWPSEESPLLICEKHVDHCRGVAQAMGVAIHLTPLAEDQSLGAVGNAPRGGE